MAQAVFDQTWDPGFDVVDLRVTFALPEAGWIRVSIEPLIKGQVACSAVFDPMRRFITWLEAIAEGASDATWLVDEEGILTRLQFCSGGTYLSGTDDFLFCIRTFSNGEVHVSGARVCRRQVVGSIYKSFRTMAGDPAYVPFEWDAHPEIANLDDLDDEQYEVVMKTHPYGGTPLQTLRSATVETYLQQGV